MLTSIDTLRIRPIKADFSESSNRFFKEDPYVILYIGDREFKSHVDRQGGLHPHWTDCFSIKAHDASMYIKVYDREHFAVDDLLGEGLVLFSAIEWHQFMATKSFPLFNKDRQVGNILLEFELTESSPSLEPPSESLFEKLKTKLVEKEREIADKIHGHHNPSQTELEETELNSEDLREPTSTPVENPTSSAPNNFKQQLIQGLNSYKDKSDLGLGSFDSCKESEKVEWRKENLDALVGGAASESRRHPCEYLVGNHKPLKGWLSTLPTKSRLGQQSDNTAKAALLHDKEVLDKIKLKVPVIENSGLRDIRADHVSRPSDSLITETHRGVKELSPTDRKDTTGEITSFKDEQIFDKAEGRKLTQKTEDLSEKIGRKFRFTDASNDSWNSDNQIKMREMN